MDNNENAQKNISKDIKLNNNKEISDAKKVEMSADITEKTNQNISEKEEKKNSTNKNNENINNDNNEDNKIKERNETINQFINEMDNKNEEKKVGVKVNKKEDEESDDPFSKAENEYRKKNAKNPNNIEEKKEIVIKSNNKEVSENLRYKNEKDRNASKKKNKKSKEKELIQKLIYNHFKRGLNLKKTKEEYNFKPKIFKNPENLYFKAIIDTEINKLKMKSYDRKTGIFDIKNFNKTKNNYINKNKQYNNYFNSTKTSFNYNSSNSRDYLKTLSYNNYSKNVKNENKNNINNLNKKNLVINNENNNFYSIKNINSDIFTEDRNFFYTSVSANNPQTKTIETNIPEGNISEKKIKINKNKKLIINSANNKISTEKMRSYLLEYHKNKIKSRANSLLTSNNQKRSRTNSKNSIQKLLNSINDPKNPYSINFSRNLLKKHYNLDIGFNKFELGVPLLNIKQTKNRYKSFNFFNDKIKPKDRMAKTSYNHFPSRIQIFNTNKNNSKKNNRYKFSMTQSGFNFYKKW